MLSRCDGFLNGFCKRIQFWFSMDGLENPVV